LRWRPPCWRSSRNGLIGRRVRIALRRCYEGRVVATLTMYGVKRGYVGEKRRSERGRGAVRENALRIAEPGAEKDSPNPYSRHKLQHHLQESNFGCASAEKEHVGEVVVLR
jgi:hypothetical protein